MADTSKVSFGLDQIANETPEFANWIFRGYFIISKAFYGWAVAATLFTPHTLFILLTTISLLIDPIMYGFSKLFGIETVAPDPSQPFVAGAQLDDKGDSHATNPVVLAPQDPVAAAPPLIDRTLSVYK